MIVRQGGKLVKVDVGKTAKYFGNWRGWLYWLCSNSGIA